MARENFDLVLAGKEPRGFIQPQDHLMVFTPGEHGMNNVLQPNGTSIGLDWFGCSWTEMNGDSPISGATLTPNTVPYDDIADCIAAIPSKEEVLAFDWAGCAAQQLAHYRRDEQVLEVRSLIGFFERMHSLIGFENALCSFYEDPDGVHDFLSAMLDYKKVVTGCVKEHFDPDIIIFDDDYGTAQSTFLSPDMWREFFPSYWKSLTDFVHLLGMKAELHSCGYITPLVGDFVDCGFDILQPLQTHNDLKGIKETYGDKLILRLAIFDKQMSAVGKSEDEVRADLLGWYKTLAPGGRFIPDLVPIQDRYYELQREVHDAYGKELYPQGQ